MSRRLMVVLFSALLIAGLTACGDDGGIDEETTTTTTAEETTTTEEDGGGEGGEQGGSLPDGQDPGDLGDGAGFDALAESCFEGDMAACDYLYVSTPVDSSSEAYGDTCGGRVDAADSEATCSSEFEWDVPAGQTVDGSLGDDSDLDDLVDECSDGDFASCDTLYTDSPADSDYEVYGLTCGGRLPTEATEEILTAVQSAGPGCDSTYGVA